MSVNTYTAIFTTFGLVLFYILYAGTRRLIIKQWRKRKPAERPTPESRHKAGPKDYWR